jgi:hypothetical protein
MPLRNPWSSHTVAFNMSTLPNVRFRFVAAVALISLAATALTGQAQRRTRVELFFPNPPAGLTLKCDFHIHTVFSDGLVWPTVRVEEAWREGLDAIAITDHIEYHPHKADVSTNYHRSYELAQPAAKSLGLILIKAAEITRGEPPGHLNALFVDKPELLNVTNNLAAVQAAAEQGAFVFWNHPGWKQPFQKPVWYAEQGEFYDRGWLKGIEVVNGDDYYPLVHKWALERKLALLGDSDIHNPIGLEQEPGGPAHRPMTLVFAAERSAAAIKDALLARRTAVYWQNFLIGSEEFLAPLFYQSLELKTPEVAIKGKGSALVQFYNRCPVNFQLELDGALAEVALPRTVTLWAGKTSLLQLTGKSSSLSESRSLALPFRVTNLKIAPTRSLPVELKVQVAFSQ